MFYLVIKLILAWTGAGKMSSVYGSVINQKLERILNLSGDQIPFNYLFQECEWNRHTQKIRIYHECEGRIEQSVPRIAVWHHEACRVMTNGDPEGRILLSYPHTNNGFVSLLTSFYLFINSLLF